jgi:formylglycine-generating enzyme required for sulfatase activity
VLGAGVAFALVLVQGERHVSANEPEQPAPRCPAEMAQVGATCIDRWEAHLLERDASGTLVTFPAAERPLSPFLVAASRPSVRPQGYINRVEAARACENAGKRLCSVSEWYRACRGPEGSVYPYGDRFAKGRCNVGKPHLLSLLYGKDPRGWRYDEHFNNPELDRRPGFLAGTGEYDGCVSAYGVYDLVGNLHEWVSDRVDPSLADKLPLTDGIRHRLRSNAGKGVFMGGFFSTTNQHGEGCNFITTAHEPRYHDYSTGFRCCKDG